MTIEGMEMIGVPNYTGLIFISQETFIHNKTAGDYGLRQFMERQVRGPDRT